MPQRISKTLLFWPVAAAPMLGAETELDIRQFGAKPDGETLCTEAIQNAVDHCEANGGGRVVIPTGRYLSGMILMKSNVELHLQHNAVLLASTNREDYPLQPVSKYSSLYNERGTMALLYAEGLSNIALTGSGQIDGQGASWKQGNVRIGAFDERPRIILFISCKNIRVEGLQLRNSPMWMQHYLDCENLTVRGVSVWNHVNYNNDAIDLDGCRRVVISDCHFDTDDDGLTLKSTGMAPNEHVVISNCTVSSFCNAIKIGTESTGGFRNITISNCVVTPSACKTPPIFGTPRSIAGRVSLS